jgi:hypothetical protein
VLPRVPDDLTMTALVPHQAPGDEPTGAEASSARTLGASTTDAEPPTGQWRTVPTQSPAPWSQAESSTT